MNHLPYSTYQHSPLTVPYLAGPKYDGQGFEGFPQRQGYNISQILRGDYANVSMTELEAFLQSWLFFALMNQILDCPIIEADFIKEDASGQLVLNTSVYISLRDVRREKEESWLFLKKQAWYNASYDAVKKATECLTKLASNAHHGIATMPLRPEIEVCLSIMVSTLTFEVAHMFSSGIPTRPCVHNRGLETCAMLMDKMRTDGWCKSQVEMLACGMDAAAMYYIGTLGPPKNPKNHSRCSNEKCEADQILEGQYVTKHRSDDCQCEHLGLDIAQVTTILSSGGVPYIELGVDRRQGSSNFDGGQTVTIKIKAMLFREGDHYIALSHIWSDGLGNPGTNTLPQCQLLWLYDLLLALPLTLTPGRKDGAVYFWMDTLCVPLQPYTARRQAIHCMRRVYSEARAVLVLESELLLSTANCTNEERLMRITCSTWLRRLWTYQEGFLAQSLMFQFAERAITMEELWYPLFKGSVYDRFSNGIAVQGARFYQTLSWNKRYNAPCQFLSLLDALQWRMTNKSQDESICIASLFKLDTNQIMGLSDDQKFKKLLQLQGTFVKDIIFLSGPRMSEEGYGWAPPSLMRRRGPEVLDLVKSAYKQTVHARWTPHGLLGEWHGLEIFGTRGNYVPETFLLACSTNRMRYIITRATESNPNDMLDWGAVGPHTMESTVIILERSLEQIRGRVHTRAILGEIRYKNHGVWFVRYKCRMAVKEYEEVDAISHGWKLDRQGIPATAREDGEERKHHGYSWCIM
ncbi:hypothetical protein BOTCAL_1298g00010 [Botryotinia calthae]|uniref:Heterokaryon incompatibility domain-containing protein n=1 Tax=Botryotinia calthae TaxID=38488 RepID=A0A4Y8CCT0_9HELO|nr:hypothetical protein BOTCAL_1298g00010 [Botryotinia calthae]